MMKKRSFSNRCNLYLNSQSEKYTRPRVYTPARHHRFRAEYFTKKKMKKKTKKLISPQLYSAIHTRTGKHVHK